MIKESNPIRTQDKQSKATEPSAYHTESEGAALQAPQYNPTADNSGGQLVQKMQSGLGTDFSDTKMVKNSPVAKQMGAQAVTQGGTIHFSPGSYAPDTKKGQDILGHELVHVSQQAKGQVSQDSKVGNNAVNTDHNLEHQAEAERDNITSGGQATSSLQNANTQNAADSNVSQGFLGKMFNKVKGAVSSIGSSIKKTATAGLNFGKGLFNKGAGAISSGIKKAKSFGSGIFSSVKNGLSNGIEAAKGFGSNVLNKVKDVGGGIWEGIKKVGSAGGDAIKGVLENIASKGASAFDFMKGVGSNMAEKAKKLLTKVKVIAKKGGSYLKNVGQGVWGVIKGLGGGMASSVGKLLKGDFMGALKGLGSTLAETLTRGIGTFLDATGGLLDDFMGPEGEEVSENEIPSRHVMDEFTAHRLAYKTPEDLTNGAGLSKKEKAILEAGGYDSENMMVKTGPNGFQAVLIMPSEEGVLPMLAIRGTQDLAGVITDIDPEQVGDFQYKNNSATIAAMIEAAGGKVDLSGHSLGGAMAQIIAANHTSSVGRVTTFQAPGVSAETTAKYNDNVSQMAEEDRPEVAHHTVKHDLVSKAGEENLPGTIYEHDLGNIDPITAHTSYVSATEGFEDVRNQYGITNDFMENEIGKEITDESVIEKFDEQPHKYKRLISEFVRGGIGDIRELAVSGGKAIGAAYGKGKELVGNLINAAKSKGSTGLKKLKGFFKSIVGG